MPIRRFLRDIFKNLPPKVVPEEYLRFTVRNIPFLNSSLSITSHNLKYEIRYIFIIPRDFKVIQV
jgi:hypothetical protein